MPYWKGKKTIKFVWHTKGLGRVETLTLRKSGIDYANERYEKLKKKIGLKK